MATEGRLSPAHPVVEPGAAGVRRYTLRAAAVTIGIGVGMIGALGYLLGEVGNEPAGWQAAHQGTDPDAPFDVVTRQTEEGIYIGYPMAAFDAAQQERYDDRALSDTVLAWHEDHPDARILGIRPQHAHDGTLMGYLIVLDPASLDGAAR